MHFPISFSRLYNGIMMLTFFISPEFEPQQAFPDFYGPRGIETFAGELVTVNQPFAQQFRIVGPAFGVRAVESFVQAAVGRKLVAPQCPDPEVHLRVYPRFLVGERHAEGCAQQIPLDSLRAEGLPV